MFEALIAIVLLVGLPTAFHYFIVKTYNKESLFFGEDYIGPLDDNDLDNVGCEESKHVD